jgi:hypothetical protein
MKRIFVEQNKSEGIYRRPFSISQNKQGKTANANPIYLSSIPSSNKFISRNVFFSAWSPRSCPLSRRRQDCRWQSFDRSG